ncbi:serine hydrolase domain-containing protein [Singulisphaera sp. PoT]|uniref:serine hydrolase domain-containing protein n=1 Tax=Singulisphaera sp. PoT TaxID=3411797 RepID=UPI003BF4E424
MTRILRRDFLRASATGVLPGLIGRTALGAAEETSELDDFIEQRRRAAQIPGLTACIVKGRKVVWSKGYGWADIEKRRPMDPDATVQNIGSISKTIVATAIMQLWEKGEFQLDDDVNERLPFAVRNPNHPETPITYRLLLTHRAGIADSLAYGSSYACGDPTLSLEEWLQAYLTPGGRYYSQKDNFHTWKPGQKRQYSNLGFGLLGFLVERLSKESFPAYTRKNIFTRLEMKRTGWLLSETDLPNHVVPYVAAGKSKADKEELEVYRKFKLLAGEVVNEPKSGDYHPICLYSFPNYPDGGLRTSVNQLARFTLAYMNQGKLGDVSILKPDTVRLMLTPQSATSPEQGICWATETRNGQRHWGHNGSDPGVRTNLSFRVSDGAGVIVFANRTDADLGKINDRLFQEANRYVS